MPMSPNVYFREMKLMSQMQHSLTNWMKIAKLVQPYLECASDDMARPRGVEIKA